MTRREQIEAAIQTFAEAHRAAALVPDDAMLYQHRAAIVACDEAYCALIKAIPEPLDLPAPEDRSCSVCLASPAPHETVSFLCGRCVPSCYATQAPAAPRSTASSATGADGDCRCAKPPNTSVTSV